MKAKNSKKQSATDWEKLSTMKDSEINLSDSAELDSSFFANATLRMPKPKKPISLRLDEDIIEWYKQQGTGYQTRMNAVLRMYMQGKTGSARKVPSRRKTSNSKRSTPKYRSHKWVVVQSMTPFVCCGM